MRFVNSLLIAALAGWPTIATAQSDKPALPVALQRPALVSSLVPRSVMLDLAKAGNRMVAVGERGHIMISEDPDGKSWKQVLSPVSVTLTAVRFADAKMGWAVGHEGVILRTTDGGLTWVKRMDGVEAARLLLQEAVDRDDPLAKKNALRLIEDGPDKPFLSVLPIDDQTIFAFGGYGLALRSTDGGVTWAGWATHTKNPGGLHINSAVGEGAVILLVGEQGLLRRSEDHGESFSVVQSPYEGSYFGAVAGAANGFVIYGLRGKAFYTRDRGDSWRACAPLGTVSINAAALLDDGRIVLANAAGDLAVGRADCSVLMLKSPMEGRQIGNVAAVSAVPAGNGLVLAGAGGLRLLSFETLAQASAK